MKFDIFATKLGGGFALFICSTKAANELDTFVGGEIRMFAERFAKLVSDDTLKIRLMDNVPPYVVSLHAKDQRIKDEKDHEELRALVDSYFEAPMEAAIANQDREAVTRIFSQIPPTVANEFKLKHMSRLAPENDLDFDILVIDNKCSPISEYLAFLCSEEAVDKLQQFTTIASLGGVTAITKTEYGRLCLTLKVRYLDGVEIAVANMHAQTQLLKFKEKQLYYSMKSHFEPLLNAAGNKDEIIKLVDQIPVGGYRSSVESRYLV